MVVTLAMLACAPVDAVAGGDTGLDTRDVDPVRVGSDTGGHADDTGDWPEVDTAACEETSASYDECCFTGRAERADAYLLDDWEGVAWSEALEGITVLESAEALDAWWATVAAEGRTDVDFATEVAVGWLGMTDDYCDHRAFGGLRAGDEPGTWVAGDFRWTWCGYYPEYGGCDDYSARATLWVAPLGAVTTCSYGGFCDG